MRSLKSNKESILPPRHMEEKQWVRSVREKGDRDAFEKIFRVYYNRLHGFAYSYVRQREIAEDIVQSVFFKIWAQKEHWDPPGTVKQYLFAAVRNEALNKIRHQKVVADAEADVIDSFEELKSYSLPDDDSNVKKLRRDIQEGIDQLPPRCRQIFILNRRSGLTYTEIADYLEISINTVNTQMGRALKSLRNHLSDYLQVLIATGISRLFF